ncbi:MAG: hypothetical protein WCA22_17880 [Candidatus Binatus sp.]
MRLLHLEIATGLIIVLAAKLWCGSMAWAYPGGPLQDVTDAAPYCAGCHSSTDANQLRDMQGPRKQQMLAASHISAIKAGQGNYSKLTLEQRNQLAADVEKVDDNAKVSIDVPAVVSRGADFAARVEAQGGSGPVVGLMLLDGDLRNQSRAIEAEGFTIVGAPGVIGPDGKPQEQWEARRYDDLARNLNFLVVFAVKADLATNQFSTSKVTYNLTAPSKPGRYTMCAAFLYGTEKASPIGRVEMHGQILPLGGYAGASGRIRFSELKTIEVR